MQALASAADVVAASADELAFNAAAGRPRNIAILPILVVSEDTLWVAPYSSNGRTAQDPRPVSEVTFYLGRKYSLPRENVPFTISHLHIYTRRHIDTLFADITGGGMIWRELFNL